MFLYKLEVITQSAGPFVAVVLADSDEKAFSYAESQLNRQHLIPPTIQEISLVEKKRVEKGKGYVIQTTDL
ncbi:DUF3906 family protein [Brevibacillus humidisoli]|uniref:DUF3906 family protein n=1 Tax=Brevibacillus humidisoli TaxID=2895522 RepID=UPI001E46AE7C|nr:DUF3906 family protein [Brevibacillus humidisoli]UFJ39210.1 DUF3906 family protein [Brevibacillus humidisoli]